MLKQILNLAWKLMPQVPSFNLIQQDSLCIIAVPSEVEAPPDENLFVRSLNFVTKLE